MTPNEQKLLAELVGAKATIRILKVRIKSYCDGWAGRSMKQDGFALERLRKAGEEA